MSQHLTLKATKWIKIPILIDGAEMRDLLSYLEKEAGPFSLYHVQGITKRGEGCFSQDAFLHQYDAYIQGLQQGNVVQAPSPVLSLKFDALHVIPIGEDRQLLKPKLPVIQTQINQIRYSAHDGAFRTQVYGNDAISWGLQFSYPQLYQEAYEIRKVHDLPNTALFRAFQKWVRESTRPTPFIVDGKRRNEPIRLGKKCFTWINQHPQLKDQQISVDA